MVDIGKFGAMGAAIFLMPWFNFSHAAAFESVAQSRFIEISGELRVFDIENQKLTAATFSDGARALPGDWDPLRKGMDISIPESSCFGQGVAYQSLEVKGGVIRFSGTADVNMSGSSGYPYMLEGHGGAVVSFEYVFNVAEVQAVDLTMSSTVGEFRDDDYSFFLKSDGGGNVWSGTGVVTEDGNTTRNFSRRLILNPGRYTIGAHLAAGSLLSGGSSSAGRTWAEFSLASITPVPEPDAAWLSLAGLAGLGVARARRKHLPVVTAQLT